jgi:acetolactate synthase-1/2/3 large subunit
MKYAEKLLDYLKSDFGFTHCFFVAGGNTMHLLDAARSRLVCIPVIHEVAAAIAVEYFNQSNEQGNKAFALVTAGPGVTNVVTGVAGAFLESREMLVIGGQVKLSDLKSEGMRQRGIQEIDGCSILKSITNHSIRFDIPLEMDEVGRYLEITGRPGPIFFEIPLDVQAKPVRLDLKRHRPLPPPFVDTEAEQLFLTDVLVALESSRRPILLLGGGLKRSTSWEITEQLSLLGIPIMTTWNGVDHYGADLDNYWGRPNTWGQRSANILLQQCDLLIAVGTRLSLQQTGFAWEEFCPLAKIFQVDISNEELEKGHPKIESGLASDANSFINSFVEKFVPVEPGFADWLGFGAKVRNSFSLSDPANTNGDAYVNPFEFLLELSHQLESSDVIIPCSSGGAFTVTLQALNTKHGQIVISNKGLASMGYGLSGAIGAAISTTKRTVLIEGDGGFSQNFQELGTVVQQALNLKIFVFSNQGYASIRMTQRNYFGGAYLGCDVATGLGMPSWEIIANAYGIPFTRLDGLINLPETLRDILEMTGPQMICVEIDPEQTYWPKINSKITPDGSMISNPLHLMTPILTENETKEHLPYLFGKVRTEH